MTHEPAPADAVVQPGSGVPDVASDLGRRAARGSVYLAVSALASKGGIAAVLLVLAATLSPRELGVLAIGALVVNIAMSVQDLGFSEVLTYQKDRIETAARTALTMMLVTGALSTAVVVGGAPWIARFFDAPDARGVVIGLGSVLACYAVAMVPVGLLTRSLNFRRRSVVLTVPGLVGGVLTVVLAVGGYGVASLVVGQVLAGILTLVLALTLGPRVRPGWDTGVAREMLRYGRSLFGAGLIGLVQLNIDYVLVGRFLSATALGVYSLAFRIAILPFFAVGQVINGAAFPLYCRLPTREDVGRAFTRVTGVILLVTLPLVTGLVVFAPSITLLGSKWLPAVGVLRWLAVFVLFYSLAQTAMVLLKAIGRPALTLACSALHLGLLVVGLLVSVHHGLAWVGITQALVALVVCLVAWRWALREVPVDLTVLAAGLRAPALGAAAMAAVGFLGRRLPELSDAGSWTQTVPLALVAVAAFVGVVVLLDRAALTSLRSSLRA